MSLITETAYIGEGVTLGRDVKIGPGAVLLGPLTVGDGVWIGPGAQLGAPPEISSLPQNAAWAGDQRHAGVIIADGAVIREGAVIHQGSHRPTTVGANCWILNRAYLAHDVQVGAGTTISAGVSIGGHCTIGERVNIGMNAVVHQRRVIANGAMVGMGTPVTRDVPPFAKLYGTPPRITGVNSVGMERSGVNPAAAELLWERYLAGDTLLWDEAVVSALVSAGSAPGNEGESVLAKALLHWQQFTDLRPARTADESAV